MPGFDIKLLPEVAGLRSRARVYPQIFVFVASILILHACGFKLRGSLDLSADISPVYVEQKTAFELVREIKSLLTSNKIEISETAKNAKLQLLIVNEKKTSRVLSVDSGGQNREYLLIYKVDFAFSTENAVQADDNNQKKQSLEDSISISRNLLFDTGAVLGFTKEAEILYKDMRRDAARLILLKLQAFSHTSSMQTSSHETQPADTSNVNKVDEVRQQ